MWPHQSCVLSVACDHAVLDCVVTASKLTQIMLAIVILVSLDNVATPILCIVSGMCQQKFGPKKVFTN